MQTILLSAMFAGMVAIAVTVAIERWGGVIGGIIGTLPTTIVPAAIGMYLAGGQDALSTSLSLVPFWMVLNSLFVGLWVIYPRFRQDVKLLEMTIISLLSWAFLAILFSLCLNFSIERYSRFLIGLLGMLVLITLGIWMTWKPTDAPKGNRPVSHGVLLSRGIGAAIAIGIAVYLSGLGMPLIAGLASVFPAIFLTTMVGLWVSQGPEVPTGAAGPMMLGGSSVGAYALVATWALHEHGMILGSIISWTVAVLSTSLPAFLWLRYKSSPKLENSLTPP
ncbi:MAG: hypothetical protein HN696_00705 [Euryarchaeota archaeon]|nr:hypothetical protein [Euryarchaeota archaeon]